MVILYGLFRQERRRGKKCIDADAVIYIITRHSIAKVIQSFVIYEIITFSFLLGQP